MASYAPSCRQRLCLVPVGHKLVIAGAENIQMYLHGAIVSEDYLIHHVAKLTIFSARLRLQKNMLFPDKSMMIIAARVGFLGPVISAESVRTQTTTKLTWRS